ncbi:hypothetical protein [Cylindrospermum sp. FACHB-282]|uniref:hypothetical protein n=1 Tax=Cylindrospermum sp. FACHB-282 TaxID=2692794 RepID=UPI0016820DD3|nr:hypothetical protein [Cylindrospermum sp. FACHB-282]MBD2388442.1 hypothetical protein [Cylindrospermum sp. FACHB-282]
MSQISAIVKYIPDVRASARYMYMMTESLDKYVLKQGRLNKTFNDTFKQVKILKQNGEVITKTVKTVQQSAKKAAEESSKMKKLLDALLKPIKGASDYVKAGKLGASFPALLGLLGIVALFTSQTKLTELTQDAQIKSTDSLADSLSKVLAIAIRGVQGARIANNKLEEARLENQRLRDRIYGLEKQQPKIRENANNALYEVRAGRGILQAGIDAAKKAANDALAEARSYNTKQNNAIANLRNDFNKYITNASNNFQQTIQTNISNIQKGLSEAQQASKLANENIKKANENIGLQSKLISSIQSTLKGINNTTNEATGLIASVTERVTSAVLPEIKTAQKGIIELKNENSIIRIDLDSFEKAEQAKNSVLVSNDNLIFGSISNLAGQINQQNDQISQIRNGVVTSPSITGLTKSVENQEKKLNGLESNLNQLKSTNTGLRADLSNLDTKLRDTERVNQEANKKLDQMFPLLNQIPLIPARAASAIKPNLITPSQVTQSTGAAICSSAQGGCLSNALNNQANNINNNSNQNKGDLLDAFNATSNAGSNAQLIEVLDRLGDKIPGGLSGKLNNMATWLQLDKVLNILTFLASVHNAMMLSNNLGQTLLQIINNGLATIGIKDDAGNPLDAATIINSNIEAFVKSIVGAENYAQISADWTKANRIYQAGANIISSIASMNDVILNGIELCAGSVAKVANGLRNWRVLGEKAYGVMNPQPNLKWGIFNKLQKGQESADFILQISQVPLDLTQAATEFTNSATELTKAIKEDPEIPPGLKVEEAEVTKTQEATIKAASIAALVESIDLDPDED